MSLTCAADGLRAVAKRVCTYSKSVAAFSSVTGMKEITFLWRPSTHAVSAELANTWSKRKKAV